MSDRKPIEGKRHEPCNSCSSSDAMTLFEDGGSYCHSCKTNIVGKSNYTSKTVVKKDTKLLEGEYLKIEPRGITKETCKFYDYKINQEKKVHIANYRNNDTQIVAQKTRTADKQFRMLGDSSDLQFFGQHTCNPKNNKIIIAEGEIDAMSINQVFNLKYNVVSIPQGAGNSSKYFKKHFEFINRHDEIILAFDGDEAGQNAIEDVFGLFEFNKVKKLSYPEGYKDANEILVKGDSNTLMRTILSADNIKPQGIILGKDIVSKANLRKKREKGTPLQFPMLNEMLMGIHKGQLICLTAGSGIGKSTYAKQWVYDLIKNHNKKCGMIMLEEENDTTINSLLCIDNEVNIKDYIFDPDIISDKNFDESYEEIVLKNDGENLVFFDHFGSINSDTLIDKLRFMKMVQGVDIILLDHISMVVSGTTLDERKELDIIMTKLATLCKETGLIVIFVVHLSRSAGKNFNEGGQVSLKDLRGSAGIEQLSHTVIGLERNQQSKEEQNKVNIRVLKNRFGGELGLADTLEYNGRKGILELITEEEVIQQKIKVNVESDTKITYGTVADF